ncbi:MAG: LysM peptidoglycan-binding domain-containing protein [Bacteroidales bacterium]|nr:LysM peptidoglycan-binding domain-containing protein [Bacteroidales bacterium]MBD5288852.1 LysM peptidoglycan-binding domain-containing protein [Bacteroides sp.]MBD5387569.1 LysM peptidoglycan-binding domain-containing protein [bacterium]MDE6256672.1 glucosaminidase domain-containing protein [Muribaculaceae bacterium]
MNFTFRYHSYTRRIILILTLLATSAGTIIYAATDHYQAYIDRYAEIAVAEQRAHGIPASITLAQGLLESAAGRSSLATKGNNHFGIKCHSTWRGDTLLRNDDAANECFRVYSSAAESYADHSRFLLGKRYRPLFDFDITDYTSWAHGLKRCGYATDPNYASRLIAIIERYNLYLYDSAEGRRHTEDIADMIHNVLRSSHKVKKSRGLHYVVAFPGDTYATIAKEFGLNVKKLLAINDVTKDSEIKAWQEVYLVEKLDVPPEGIKSATIGDDESIHSIAQRFGMRLKTILELNPKAKDRPGTRLKLQ